MKQTTARPPAVTAYSYIRFSHPDQAKGDSERRQLKATADWCERNGAVLDSTMAYKDPGVSAFKGAHRGNGHRGNGRRTNPDRQGLAAFLKLVEGGKVARGSYLVIENLDRLSREHIRPALTLLLNLIDSGIRVVQLKPVEMVYGEDVDPIPLMMAIMELSRGHSESAMKSERCGAKWAEKRRLAREGKDQPPRRKDGRVTRAITSRLPAWVREHGGKLEEIPEKVALLRRIFEMAASGLGYGRIVHTMLKERVPPLGGKSWRHSYLSWMLHDRRVLGECQPKSKGKADGLPVKGYFPAVIPESLFLQVQAALGSRRSKNFAGRPGEGRVNLFRGLLFDAKTGATYRMAKVHGFRRKDGTRNAASIVLAAGGVRGGTLSSNSFPMVTLEKGILGMLWEIDPAEIVEEGLDEAAGLEAELEAVRIRLEEIRAALVAGGGATITTLAAAATDLEAQERELARKVQEAQEEAASPLAAAWKEGQTLAAALDSASDPDAARLKLRAVLRRAVSEIRMVTARRGNSRLAAVQVFFRAGGSRFYQIMHQHPSANGKASQPGRWWASSGRCGSIDLRTPDGAALALEGLAAFNPDQLEAAGGEYEWDRAGCLQRSGIIGQPDDPGYRGIPRPGRPRKPK
jgi:DNA invertase Pin-like site-specific DNA recombinase